MNSIHRFAKPSSFLFAAALALVTAGCHRRSAPKVPGQSASAKAANSQSAVTALPFRISIAAMNRRVPVIMFHDVLPAGSPGMVWFDDTTAQFQAQMQFIKDNGLVPITVDQLYHHLEEGADIPANAICLTFDDNYLGFYQNAYPILKQFGYPAAMFVHTNFVGDMSGDHPKMNWSQLQELVKGGLVTIGSHTESHPMDMTILTDKQQTTEIAGSKTILEKHLGVPINYIAWPDGKFNQISIAIAQQAGYKMGLAMDHGFAEESPGMFQIHRWSWEKMQEGVQDRDELVTDVPVAIDQVAWTQKPVQLHVQTVDGLKIAWVSGGTPETMMSDMREGVLDFVRDSGAAAGVNGGFFAMSSLYSTSNLMIGPCYTNDRKVFNPGGHAGVLDRLRNRPVIFWSDKGAVICPFQPETMNDEAIYRAFMPDMKNLFVAGAWMVHQGIPMTDDQMLKFDSKDLDDPRRRAFFGWTADGQPVAGASLQTCTTERLAEVVAKAGIVDAVLLDSGFSTSLVYNDKIVVTGHTAKDIPSRPVPHAIVFMGQLDLAGIDDLMKSAAIGAIDPSDVVGARRGRRHSDRVQKLVPIGGGPAVKDDETGGVKVDVVPTGKKGSDSGSVGGLEKGPGEGSTGGAKGPDSGSSGGETAGGTGDGKTSGGTGKDSGSTGGTGKGESSAGGTGKGTGSAGGAGKDSSSGGGNGA